MIKISLFASSLLNGFSNLSGSKNADISQPAAGKEIKASQSYPIEYFNLRPNLEKEYSYTHAVRIGDDLKISGAVTLKPDCCL